MSNTFQAWKGQQAKYVRQNSNTLHKTIEERTGMAACLVICLTFFFLNSKLFISEDSVHT